MICEIREQEGWIMLCENKIAVVTASTRGIGHACALKLAENGAKVYIAARNEERAKGVIEEIVSKGGQAGYTRFDASDRSTFAVCVKDAVDKEGKINILVNNFGTTRVDRDYDVANTKFEDFAAIVEENIESVYESSQAAIAAMKEQGGLSIVNIASVGGVYPDLSREAYGLAKSAVIRLTKDIALQNARAGIRANAVCPGCIATEAVSKNMTPEFTKAFLATVPLNRLGEPEDIANAVLFYASDMSSYVTGGVMEVSGGFGLGTPLYPLYQSMSTKG